jgi:hypothetical protein
VAASPLAGVATQAMPPFSAPRSPGAPLMVILVREPETLTFSSLPSAVLMVTSRPSFSTFVMVAFACAKIQAEHTAEMQKKESAFETNNS